MGNPANVKKLLSLCEVKMKRPEKILFMKTLLFGALLLLSACTSVRHPLQDTDNLLTYTVLQNHDYDRLSVQQQQVISAEIDRQLQARGYRRAVQGGDLAVLFSLEKEKFTLPGETGPVAYRGNTLLLQLVDTRLNRSVYLGGVSQRSSKGAYGLQQATRQAIDEYGGFAGAFLRK